MINPRAILAVGDLTSLRTITGVCEPMSFRDRSLFIPGGEDFGGDHLIYGRTKRGISRNCEPKRWDRGKLWKDSESGPLKFAWKMKTKGAGIAKVNKSF